MRHLGSDGHAEQDLSSMQVIKENNSFLGGRSSLTTLTEKVPD